MNDEVNWNEEISKIAILTIRNIDEALKAKLKVIAAQHGISVEEEVRRILQDAILPESQKKGLGSRIHKRFANVGGVYLELPEKKPAH